MPLESLDKEINIHDLAVEPGESAWQGADVRKMYERIMQPEFLGSYIFDKEQGLWIETAVYTESVTKKQSVKFEKDADVNLLWVLSEAQINPSAAVSDLRRLMTTNLYNPEIHGWYSTIYRDEDKTQEQPFTDTLRLSSHFLEILIRANGDPAIAKEEYEKLKLTSYYNADGNGEMEPGSWYERINSNSKPDMNETGGRGYDTSFDCQLYEVLVKAIFDRPAALVQYEKMKSERDNYYDADSGFWHPYAWRDKNLFSDNQLLGVMCEAEFNKENAREIYLALKESALFDRDKNLWKYRDDEVEDEETWNYHLENEFLALLCEVALKDDPKDLNDQVPALPEVKQY